MTESTPRRCWTLEGARALIAEVRERTAQAVAQVEALLERRESCEPGSEEYTEVEQSLRIAVSRWVRAMEALGLEVKGMWLVDFDNGQGCFCWKWPEEELLYFHGYEEGFAGRVRIQ